MKTILLKNGEELLIREGKIGDAKKVIEQIKKAGDETNFLTFSGDEFKNSLGEEEKIIRNHAEAKNQLLILGILNNEIVSVSNIIASQKPRLIHIGELGISVTKEHWNKGIGKEMMRFMLEWAKANPVMKKINLSVNATNTKAIRIYENLGFKHEGRRSMDIFVDGKYLDGIYMGIEV